MNTERTYKIVWPERRMVPESKMRQWAMDAVDNGEIDGPKELDTRSLAMQMHDAGLITWVVQMEDVI